MLNHADLTRVDLNLLVVFQVVLEERHVGRAAARLSLTSSAVSHGLGRLRSLFEDPLFLRTPKGVVPTARASELAAPIADILSRVSHVMESGARFDPAISSRRFTIGAPDAVSAVILPRLISDLRATRPGSTSPCATFSLSTHSRSWSAARSISSSRPSKTFPSASPRE